MFYIKKFTVLNSNISYSKLFEIARIDDLVVDELVLKHVYLFKLEFFKIKYEYINVLNFTNFEIEDANMDTFTFITNREIILNNLLFENIT